jgi:glutamate synthase domain-containing protein 2
MTVRNYFYLSFLFLIPLGIVFTYFQIHPVAFWILFSLYSLVGFYDIHSSHSILRNYPIIGTFRFLLEAIRPEIQQYFIESDLNGKPYSREQRTLVYRRAKNLSDTAPFGTQHNINAPEYHFTLHSLSPAVFDEHDLRFQIGNHQCKQPYSASILNISAMSYGSLSNAAILALNLGAKMGNFMHNTGEGGLTDHHLAHGADLCLQIGTGYFSMRHPDGTFSPELFKKISHLPTVKCIEIKLSQGAKPSHGGVLPKAKISEEIARIRLITNEHDCISPPTHSTFTTPLEMMDFITQLRDLSDGKPIGFKLCLGAHHEFMSICKAMIEKNVFPDFITIDGAEGGTGAAPVEFSNSMGTPANEALAFVHNTLVGLNIRQHIRLLVAGKAVSGFDILMKLALGADGVNMARTMMFALGCIQSLRCNENTCPTGVATSNPRRGKALLPLEKGPRVAHYHKNTLHSFVELAGAVGVHNKQGLVPELIRHRQDDGHSVSYDAYANYILPGAILDGTAPRLYLKPWHACSSRSFSIIKAPAQA